VLDEIDFASACRRSMRDVLAWCARRDVPMWLVSASPLCVALAAARRLGIAHVVAMTPATDGTLLLPRLAGEPTYGDGKLVRLRQAVPNTRILAAFGDSYWDVAMMEEARFGVGVCPNDDMRRRLDELPNAYVLED
jgi:phosphoserine phosphatase